MKTFATLHKIINEDKTETLTVNIPGMTDMFFPLCSPNQEYLKGQNVIITNPEFLNEENPFKEGQIVYGLNTVRNNYEKNMEVENHFTIEQFFTSEEYKKFQ